MRCEMFLPGDLNKCEQEAQVRYAYKDTQKYLCWEHFRQMKVVAMEDFKETNRGATSKSNAPI